MVVSNHWTGLLDLPILPLLVRAEAKCAYYLLLRLGQYLVEYLSIVDSQFMCIIFSLQLI